MPTPVFVPKATITMEEATIVGWLKQAGESVSKDEALFEMETDKVVMEVRSPESGILLRIDTLSGPAGFDRPVAWIGRAGEAIPEAFQAPRDAAPDAVDAPISPSLTVSMAAGAIVEPAPAPASPAARRRARELGLDIASIPGTGPGGRVTEADVESAQGRL